MALVCTFGPLPAQLAVLGGCVSVLAGLFVAYVEQEDIRDRQRAALLGTLRVPLALAPEHDLFDHYSVFSGALERLAHQPDPVLRRFALLKLASIGEQVRTLADGTVVFTSTETWRTVYEQLLESPGLGLYRSVAWVKTADYWQDRPGRRSMELNFERVRRGLTIERMMILRGDLWPSGQRLPSPSIRPWIEQQHERGIRVALVRELDLAGEPDLLADFGIYDERALGVQELDEHARTLRFVLSFDRESLQLARDRWERLSLYTVSYAELLQQASAAAESGAPDGEDGGEH